MYSFLSLIRVFCQTFNNSYIRKHLISIQFFALIKSIPKITNPKTVKDWRPTALLNANFENLALIISNRLKPILNFIISLVQQYDSQTDRSSSKYPLCYQLYQQLPSTTSYFSNRLLQPLTPYLTNLFFLLPLIWEL